MTTDAYVFEGPEKLLEIAFPGSVNLHAIPHQDIENLLNAVNCSILSHSTVDDNLHMYLLSESSLFLYKNKFLLKTCGKTTTLFCLDNLLKLINRYCCEFSWSDICNVFYSRKSFLFPQEQHEIHQNWSNEVTFLNRYFCEKKSKCFEYGDTEENKWYLYMHQQLPPNDNDKTFEIMMTKLDPQNESIFKFPHETDKKPEQLGLELFHQLGFDKILQLPKIATTNTITKMTTQAYLFEPCGFSSNTIIHGDSASYYYTIHITPEQNCSYFSFECNWPDLDEIAVVKYITGIVAANAGISTCIYTSTNTTPASFTNAQAQQKVPVPDHNTNYHFVPTTLQTNKNQFNISAATAVPVSSTITCPVGSETITGTSASASANSNSQNFVYHVKVANL